ncbi:WGR domain-containing protein [Ochrobactrum sp. P6BS-III]|jgi:predicted DNA-binding WGR domain protein|uniref:WGR domain-containing protein n=1 Tax=unclassified Ochrobactrum TaxID=239106 RepID=UPI000992A4B6|nr:putative DNA-binding WGR domain protein [Ochrobactrum sp. P6BSIII]OOL14661.1 WGR domain-containing protein [Ochrobactrum sp. P6BS-III]
MNRSERIDSKLSLDGRDGFSDLFDMIAQQFHLYVERTDPNKNMARYYAMHISYSLFGEPCLTRQWGRIGTSGQVKLQHFQQETEAIKMFLTVARKKQVRGYRPR